MRNYTYLLFVFLFISCNEKEKETQSDVVYQIERIDTMVNVTSKVALKDLNTANVSKHELVAYAKSLTGIPYKYASTDPAQGFDCSGFITYVFNHFHIDVPRSSVDFTNVGKPVDFSQAGEGDLILFTGTNDSIRIVGHMGIVTENTDSLRFIHSTSGRANGVTISSFSEHYKKRFVKVMRIFND
jgi:cell wall-associated NlpC family hydrolase